MDPLSYLAISSRFMLYFLYKFKIQNKGPSAFRRNVMIIGLCDDNDVQLNYIKSLITSWMNIGNVKCEVFTYNSAEQLIFENAGSFPFDLLVLDIQMGEMNGMELAKHIREYDKNIMLIFITGLRDYVFEGYEVGALRYLLKPVKEEHFMALLDEAFARMQQDNKRWFIFTHGGEKVKLNYDDIIYVEARGHYIELVTTNQSYELKGSIGQISNELGGDDFFSTHRSYIVNLKHVERINKADCRMSNEASIPVSRGNYQDLNRAFIHYYRGSCL
jgi:DNA-binding LytR/AlgR family response regulator